MLSPVNGVNSRIRDRASNMTIFRQHFFALALVVPLAVAGCTQVYRHHGYIPPDDALAQVQIGQTTQADLETLIGRPSSQGVLEGSSWYYVGSRWEYYGAREPREIDRRVLAIRFNESGVVSNVEAYGLEHGRVVELSSRVTDSGIQGAGLIRQLLGNIGRVQASDLLQD